MTDLIIAQSLDTADRLARGELSIMSFNRHYTYKLTTREWPIFDAAKTSGYMVMPRGEDSYRRLERVWSEWCEPRGWPMIMLKSRVRYATVEADTIMLCAQPADDQTHLIEHLFAEHASGGWWCNNPTYLCASRVPISVAPLVARQIVAILWRALGLAPPPVEKLN